MKYALFEFVNEKSCEIGETRWILREDEETFQNDNWDCDKDVMVLWLRDFSKVNKKILKGSVDPLSIATMTCVAKVLRFSDDYDTIRDHMVQYCRTGTIKTPNHGRGKRAPRPNGRYADSEDENEEEPVIQKPPKRARPSKQLPMTPCQNELQALTEKYRLSQKKIMHTMEDYVFEEHDSVSSDLSEDGMITKLQKENTSLRLDVANKEKKIKHLLSVISNLKAMPSLQDVVKELKEEVINLKGKETCFLRTDMPTTSTSGGKSSDSSASTSRSSSDSEVESDMIPLGPGVMLTKGQHKALKAKTNLRDYVYAAMGMLWTREVLCTHSVTGKASNAFKGRDAKPQLDPEKVQSVCEFGSRRFGCKPTEVRQMMTTRINNVVKVEKAKQKGLSDV